MTFRVPPPYFSRASYWNNRKNAEKWRAAWAAYVNRALEAAGRLERIDHRSYKRQSIDKIPSVHMGVAATQMERCGIVTEKGDMNRQIAADNKLLKEIKARLTRLYNWTKAEAAQPQGKESIMFQLLQTRMAANNPASCFAKVQRLKENAALLNFLMSNGIQTMQELYEKVSAMSRDYYNLRGKSSARNAGSTSSQSAGICLHSTKSTSLSAVSWTA